MHRDDPEAVVAASDEIVAGAQVARPRSPDAAGLGIDVGRRFAAHRSRLLGFAAMSCATLRELFTIAMRYFALTMLHIDIKLFEGPDDCLLELDADHLPADVQRFFIERDIAGIIATTTNFAHAVIQRYADDVFAEVSIDEQALRPLLALVPVHDIAFGRAHTRLHIPGRCSTNHCRRRTATP